MREKKTSPFTAAAITHILFVLRLSWTPADSLAADTSHKHRFGFWK
jgi:hypothetical protein